MSFRDIDGRKWRGDGERKGGRGKNMLADFSGKKSLQAAANQWLDKVTLP